MWVSVTEDSELDDLRSTGKSKQALTWAVSVNELEVGTVDSLRRNATYLENSFKSWSIIFYFIGDKLWNLLSYGVLCEYHQEFVFSTTSSMRKFAARASLIK